MNIVGLGQAGCRIAERFKEYPQYNIYKIDVGTKGKNCFNMPKQEHPEKYEEKFPAKKMKTFLNKIRGNVLLITSCGNISGAILRIMEYLRPKCKIEVLYVKPDRNTLGKINSLQENLVFGVLQEYARSAVIENTYIVSNAQVYKILKNVTVKEYYDKLNELIVSTFHMVNIFKHSESAINTFSNPIAPARIASIGLVDYHSGEEKMFFSLDYPREKRYYYAMPEEVLEKDGKLLENIQEQIRQNKEHKQTKSSYGIFSTKYSEIYAYCVAKASYVQENDLTSE